VIEVRGSKLFQSVAGVLPSDSERQSSLAREASTEANIVFYTSKGYANPGRAVPAGRQDVTDVPAQALGHDAGGARMDGRDATQSSWGPSDVEADDVALTNHVDARHRAANMR
jgi:hypothetical protein